MRKICAALLALMLAGNAAAEDSYDPQHTMLALNMAVVSVHRILSTQDRIILDAEYQNIINNLSIGNIRSDPEITELYRKLLDVAQGKKLRQDEAAEIQKRYDAQSRSRIKDALSEMAEIARGVLAGDENAGKIFVGLGRLLTACTAGYFRDKSEGITRNINLNDEMFRLRAEDMSDFNELQKQLLSSSWNLLNKYHLPDEYRLIQKALDDFYRAVDEPDTASRRLRMLKALEDDFRVYPPYWYYRARTAIETGDSVEAEACFDRFGEVWRPVLRKDPYMLEAVKYRINAILKDGVNDEARKNILVLAGTMRENTMREDWVNNLFAAALYYSLGEKDTAMKCAEVNIDFGYEHELSTAMLSQMRAGVDFPLLPEDTLRAVKLSRLTEGMNDSDREAAVILADYFDGRPGYSEALRGNNHPLSRHALRLIAQKGNDFGEILRLAEISGDVSCYSGALNLVKDYADGGNIPASVFLADMYNYGLGVRRDSFTAMKYYRLAGFDGDTYSQAMCVNIMLTSQDFTYQPGEPGAMSPDDQYREGMRLYNAKNYAEALEMFRRSAEAGNSSSEYMFGRMHEHGQGVSKNIDTAKEYYARAAEKGHSGAKKALKRLSGGNSWWPF
ncbi:MAG: sel1 repeat family protein [Synergistaceae bacterium]|nr:sel1 repeat family protein [Synergistaceae bacterium]